MGPAGRGFGDFPCLWRKDRHFDSRKDQSWKGLEWSCNSLNCFSAQPQCPRAKLAACQPMVCREPGLLMRSGKRTSLKAFSEAQLVNAVPFYGHSHRWQLLNMQTYNPFIDFLAATVKCPLGHQWSFHNGTKCCRYLENVSWAGKVIDYWDPLEACRSGAHVECPGNRSNNPCTTDKGGE